MGNKKCRIYTACDVSQTPKYTRHYVRMKNQAMKEYAAKYGPLSIQDIDASKHDEWKWALQPWPWEGEC